MSRWMLVVLLGAVACASVVATAATGAKSAFPGLNGRIVFARQLPFDGGSADLFVANADGSGLVRLTKNGAYDGQPAVSADGSRIAFESGRSGDIDVYVMGTDASGLRQVTFSLGFDGDPTWDPSGTKIAFETTRNGASDIYAASADGTGATRLT